MAHPVIVVFGSSVTAPQWARDVAAGIWCTIGLLAAAAAVHQLRQLLELMRRRP